MPSTIDSAEVLSSGFLEDTGVRNIRRRREVSSVVNYPP